jgi:hypothetical protein
LCQLIFFVLQSIEQYQEVDQFGRAITRDRNQDNSHVKNIRNSIGEGGYGNRPRSRSRSRERRPPQNDWNNGRDDYSGGIYTLI